MNLKRIRLIAFSSFLIYLLLIFFVYLGSFSDLPLKTDFAIVFGNEVYSNGKPSARLMARLDKSIDLYQKKMVKNILVSGGIGKSKQDEAVVMANYLHSNDIPSSNILIDSSGHNSSLTSLNAAKLIGSHKSIIAVTQQFHIARVKLSLRNAGFTTVYGSYPDFSEMRDIYSYAREVPAFFYYALLGK